ncbi:MAG TPA: hypothetical protein PKJ63_05135 [Cyclobacteriaceae bacterium]|nr:hypothetical protein [Cyclobacteriaceae bacterium]
MEVGLNPLPELLYYLVPTGHNYFIPSEIQLVMLEFFPLMIAWRDRYRLPSKKLKTGIQSLNKDIDSTVAFHQGQSGFIDSTLLQNHIKFIDLLRSNFHRSP